MASSAVFIQNKKTPLLLYAASALIILFLFFFLLLPVGVILIKALQDEEGQFTLQYFSLIWQNESYLLAIANSFKLAAMTTISCLAISFPLALINSRFSYPGKKIFSVLLLAPLVLPPFVAAVGINKLFAKFGAVNLMLQEIGIISEMIDWMHSDNLFAVVVLLETIHLFPILYLNIMAAIANIDPSLEEAASILGASRLKRFRDIIWYLARPGIFAGASIVFVFAFTDLGTPLLTGWTDNVAVKIFDLVTSAASNPMGYALVILVLAVVATSFVTSRFLYARTSYPTLAKGHVQKIEEKASSATKMIFVLANIILLTLALAPHLSVLIASFSEKWFMTILPTEIGLNHYRDIWQEPISIIGIKNSLALSVVATLIDMVLGFGIAFIVTRKLLPFSNFLDGLVMLPLAIPGIVLAFGYVVCYTDTFLDPLNNPTFLLIVAYSIRRLPFMVRAASAGLSQLSLSLEEASYTLGASKSLTIYKISLPLTFANILAGAIFCFAFTMLDVSDSLILAMKDRFYPLTKAIYALYLEQGRGENLACALGSIGMLILALALSLVSIILGKKMGELFRG